MSHDRDLIQRVIQLATENVRQGGRPFACVIAESETGEIFAEAANAVAQTGDPTAHAELLALREAFHSLAAMRLPGAVVYTTLEPCFMCAGALSHARVARVVWGVRDPKFGGCVSLGAVLSDPRLNHTAEVVEGVCAEEARALLQEFFQSKR